MSEAGCSSLRVPVPTIPPPAPSEAISLKATTTQNAVFSARTVLTLLVGSFLFSQTPCALRAQSWNSYLEGLITDPSGAVIPKAEVTLKNNASGQIRHAQTDLQGFYSFPLMLVGVYDLTVAAPGLADRT